MGRTAGVPFFWHALSSGMQKLYSVHTPSMVYWRNRHGRCNEKNERYLDHNKKIRNFFRTYCPESGGKGIRYARKQLYVEYPDVLYRLYPVTSRRWYWFSDSFPETVLMHSPLHSLFDKPLLFGHRGASATAPENTLDAFRLCREEGIDGIEFDVQRCLTGELVVTHDFNLHRTTGYDALVTETSWDRIRTLDAGSHYSEKNRNAAIMQLDMLFEEFGTEMKYDIELKSDSIRDGRLAAGVWNSIQRHALQENCLVSSFNPFQVRIFRRISLDMIPTAVIYADSPDIPRILRHGWGRHIAGCSVLKPHFPLIAIDTHRPKWLRKYPVVAWTVDDRETADTFLRMGISGIISNDPGKLAPLFREFARL